MLAAEAVRAATGRARQPPPGDVRFRRREAPESASHRASAVEAGDADRDSGNARVLTDAIAEPGEPASTTAAGERPHPRRLDVGEGRLDVLVLVEREGTCFPRAVLTPAREARSRAGVRLEFEPGLAREGRRAGRRAAQPWRHARNGSFSTPERLDDDFPLRSVEPCRDGLRCIDRDRAGPGAGARRVPACESRLPSGRAVSVTTVPRP